MKHLDGITALLMEAAPPEVKKQMERELAEAKEVGRVLSAVCDLFEALNVTDEIKLKCLSSAMKGETYKLVGERPRLDLKKSIEEQKENLFLIAMIGDTVESFDRARLLHRLADMQQVLTVGGDEMVEQAKELAEEMNGKYNCPECQTNQEAETEDDQKVKEGPRVKVYEVHGSDNIGEIIQQIVKKRG